MEFCTNLRHLLNRDIRSHTFSSFYRMHNHEYWEITFNSDPLSLIHNDKPLVFPPYTAAIYRPYTDSHELRSGFHISIKIHDALFRELCQILHPSLYASLSDGAIPLSVQIETLAAQDIFRFYNNAFLIPSSALPEADCIFKITTVDILKHFLIQKLLDVPDAPEQPHWINKIVKDLQAPENFSLTVKEIVAKYHYTYTHVSRVFKEYTNENLLSFFQAHKFNYACRLLSETKMPIYEIANLIGYESPMHFTQVFKKIYSVYPKEYRTNFAKNTPPSVKKKKSDLSN